MSLAQLQTYLQTNQIDWLFIPRSDEFFGEYVPICNERLQWVSGFSGSAGIALISQTSAHLFVDGRYTIQAKQESPKFKIHPLSEIWSVIQRLITKTLTVGLNFKFHSRSFVEQLTSLGLRLQHLDPHPIDTLWEDRPQLPSSEIFPHPIKYSGESLTSKIHRVIAALPKQIDSLYVHDPHEVAWVLNIRASDLNYTPIPLCRAIIHTTGETELFLNNSNISAQLREHLGTKVLITPMDQLEKKLTNYLNIQIDSSSSAYDQKLLLNQAFVFPSPILKMQAIKNSTEIQGMRTAHHLDSIALKKFIAWIKSQPIESLSEIKSAEKLESFRKENADFRHPSFPTISGFGSNGAIVHYKATKQTNKPFSSNGLYLFDSGGQYPYGTTDITRTLTFGTPTPEQKQAYTLVLKGHIRLATAIFPKGTTGHQLDALARTDLWQLGLDYAHGTGHGVGSFLSVHEGPASISPRANNIPLEPGMVLSNEPGFYKANAYGIRIENMMVVVESHHNGFLQFETLTKAPYENALIDQELITSSERAYLDSYATFIFS